LVSLSFFKRKARFGLAHRSFWKTFSSRRMPGVAAALLERAIDHARAIGAVAMFLETAMNNVAAQSVYERAGWTREAHFCKYNAPL
jgi:GNAT superfamily N-acetyltransferase